jgi:aryl-alcohol dehydrogenase-like predicted oxidoreductase
MSAHCIRRVALGTVQFGQSYGIANLGGRVSEDVARLMLLQARAHGLDMLDTAVAYGVSEARLGAIGVASFNVVTKIPAMPVAIENVSGWVQGQVRASLDRLRLSELYGVLLHYPLQLLEARGAELFRALLSLRESGLIKKIGFSIYSPAELDSLIPRYPPDIVQAPLNLVDRRMQRTGWLDRLKNSNVEIHSRSVFLQGLLLIPRPAFPPKFAPWRELFTFWHDWLDQQGESAVRACLAFPMSFPEIDRIVVGADSLAQLNEIVLAAQGVSCLAGPDLTCNDEKLINPACWSKL